MLNKLILGSLVIFILIFVGLSRVNKEKTSVATNKNISTSPTVSLETTNLTPTDVEHETQPTSTQTPQKVQKVKLAYIMLDTNGSIGCGDSITFIQGTVNSSAVLEATLNLLLSDKSQGGPKRYNALYQSALSVQKIDLANSHADIYLTGSMSLGGTCDSPRFKAQLEQTALQFSTVKSVTFYINGRNIDEVLSEK